MSTELRCHWDACPHGANCVHATADHPTPTPSHATDAQAKEGTDV